VFKQQIPKKKTASRFDSLFDEEFSDKLTTLWFAIRMCNEWLFEYLGKTPVN
jgi:hypothetical protein